MPYLCYKWGNCNVPWNTANWRWAECQLISDILSELHPGIPGDLAVPSWLREEEPYNPYKKDKRDRFIRLLCKVKNYPEYDEKKKVRDDIKVTVEDVALVIRTVSGIDIMAK
jgi:hypothetical protein